jgi:hypothetical protein
MGPAPPVRVPAKRVALNLATKSSWLREAEPDFGASTAFPRSGYLKIATESSWLGAAEPDFVAFPRAKTQFSRGYRP